VKKRSSVLPSLALLGNVVGASAHAGLSLWVANSYVLFTPHAVGHVVAVLSTIVSALWGVHCCLLYRAIPMKFSGVRMIVVIPLVLVIVSGICIKRRYEQQYRALQEQELREPGKFMSTWYCCP
jgi:hypothetical protein